MSKKLLITCHSLIFRSFHRQQHHMSAWQVKKYNQDFNSSLFFNDKLPIPPINNPNELLIKVNASSVNPIDVRMSSGYGHNMLSLMNDVFDCGIDKITHDRLPVILGRDFSGTVIQVGQSVKKYKKGDQVWGAIPPYRQGTHANYITTHQYNVYHKPKNLTDIETASLPYVALTAWSTIKLFGMLNEHNTFGKKVLVMGGSGGVGLVANQLLKYWGANVITTCSKDAMDFVQQQTQVEHVIDYNSNELASHLDSFDFILDATSILSNPQQHHDQIIDFAIKYLRKWKNTKLVTLSPPLIDNMDHYGFIVGTAINALQASRDTISGLANGTSIRWAFFCPEPSALANITRLTQDEIIKPAIEQVISYNELPKAYEKVSRGHARGKTVIDHKKLTKQ